VEKKWHYYRLRNRGSVSYGYLKVRFFVNREGKAEDIQFVEKANNPLMEDFTLEAILKADIPPIPKELLPMLDNDRFPVEYDILIHD
jgi:outer membrane biosynthesis protein TonB